MPTREIPWETRNADGDVIASGTREVFVPYKTLTKFEFLNLFAPEKVAAALALKATTLAVFWLYYEAANSFERDHPTIVAGFGMLVSAGIYTEEAAQAVLDAWPLAGA